MKHNNFLPLGMSPIVDELNCIQSLSITTNNNLDVGHHLININIINEVYSLAPQIGYYILEVEHVLETLSESENT